MKSGRNDCVMAEKLSLRYISSLLSPFHSASKSWHEVGMNVGLIQKVLTFDCSYDDTGALRLEE